MCIIFELSYILRIQINEYQVADKDLLMFLNSFVGLNP